MEIYYFAYGSNLDADHLRERVPAAEPAGTARLEGYRLAFGGYSPHWDGPPATIVPAEGDSVAGRLYRMDRQETYILDYYEGHPVRYERRRERVRSPETGETSAQVYVKDVDGDFRTPPDVYLGILREAYHELGFDPEDLDRALALGRD